MRFLIIFSLVLAVFAGLANYSSLGAVEAEDIEQQFGQVYCQRDSGPLKADIYLPSGEGPYPGILVVHGGAWRFGTRGQLASAAQLFAKNGYAAVAISYRLAPQHKFPAQIEDCKEAVRWMRSQAEKLKLDPERIGGFGYSAGAQLVTLLGTTDPEDGLEGETELDQIDTRLQAVSCGGAPCEFRVLPADNDRLRFWLGGSRSEVPDQYRLASPAAFISPDDPPMFFYHGERDQLVPVESPQLMVRQLTNAGVESQLHVVPDMGHMFAATDQEAMKKSLAFFNKHLGNQP